jgi:hypothetical protein
MVGSRKTLFGIAGVIVLGAVAAIGLAAFSSHLSLAAPAPQTAQATPTPNGQSSAGQYNTFFFQALAQKLGVTLDALKQAIISAATDTINQALKDGRLTQNQADQLKNNLNNWFGTGNTSPKGFPFFFGFGRGRHGFGGFGRGEFSGENTLLSDAAKAFGMDQQSLLTELRGGKSIADVAQEHKVDVSQLKQTVLADVKANLDNAVKNNQLTQTQADQLYQNLSNNIDSMINQKWSAGPNYRNHPSNNRGLGG